MSELTYVFQQNIRTVASNDLAFALLTNTPITPGHSLVCPRRQVASFVELTNEELLAIRDLTADVVSRLQNIFGSEGFNFAWNQGEDFGQSIAHFHLHVVPRTPGDSGIIDYEPREFLYRPGSRKISPEAELSEIAKLLSGGSDDIASRS